MILLIRAALLYCLLPLGAFAETHEVRMLNRNNSGPMPFEPDYLVIRPGDRVRFIAASPGHNAATIEGMIPAGGEPFIGRINEEIEVTLTAEGLWGIKCSPHYTMGMVMLIQVGSSPATAADLPENLPPAARERMSEIIERQGPSD